MARVVWRNEALDDLTGIAPYIRQFDIDAAERIVQRLIDCGDSLGIFPNRGRPAFEGQRQMTSVPPYVLTYAVEGDDVFIVRIRHGARRSDG